MMGPGASVTAIFCPLIPREGISAIANTRIPMPPIQWVKERQNRIPFGSTSTSVRIDAPVVENPEQDSKNASIGFGMLPVTTKGTAPTAAEKNQHSVTTRKPSLTRRVLKSCWNIFNKKTPAATDNSMVMRNGI